ncbi:hypothetical protein GCM10010232_62300 [Streptomyces amakusaensis]
MDANADGAVAFEESCRPALGSLFALADLDDEFTRLRAATGNSSDGTDAAFAALDVNGASTVDRDSCLAAIRDFLTTGNSPWPVRTRTATPTRPAPSPPETGDERKTGRVRRRW